MDRAAAFTLITQRNALRRAAQLPLLDVREELDKAANLAAWDAFGKEAARHAERRRAITEAVLAEYRAKFGPDFPSTSSGQYMLQVIVGQRFHAYLERLGVVRPPLRGAIPYGAPD